MRPNPDWSLPITPAEWNGLTILIMRNCRLFFDLTGRIRHIEAGGRDWPCDEIYIASKETATGGTVYYDRLFLEEIGEYSDVTLFDENGRVIGSSKREAAGCPERLPPENTVICELGLGMNPDVTD